ncbi:hypothetical protein I5770_14615 [Brucella sp. BO2]|nr:hypothetical protein I5770_14615 [Brucella sp. BO2]
MTRIFSKNRFTLFGMRSKGTSLIGTSEMTLFRINYPLKIKVSRFLNFNEFERCIFLVPHLR